jgi:hypothetical protein
MTGYDEERLAELLSALPAPPRGWVEAAQQLPRFKSEADRLVARAEADAAFRAALIDDLEAALRLEGVEPSQPVVARLRKHLSS